MHPPVPRCVPLLAMRRSASSSSCKAAEITVWGRADLKDVEDSNLGLKGSPTQIAKASDKVRKGAGEKVTLDPAEAVDYIVDKLKVKHVI